MKVNEISFEENLKRMKAEKLSAKELLINLFIAILNEQLRLGNKIIKIEIR